MRATSLAIALAFLVPAGCAIEDPDVEPGDDPGGKADGTGIGNDRGHLETFRVDGAVIDGVELPGRTLFIWFPHAPITHTLYVHDGQNLWAGPNSWRLHEHIPAGMLVVGIANAGFGRLSEYTHVPDAAGGGNAAAYAKYVQDVVRPRVRSIILGGDEKTVGVMGSSLGGTVALYMADAFPDDYAFAASLSGNLYWGSDGEGFHNETIVERYAKHGRRRTKIYIDSGGGITDPDATRFVSHSAGDCLDLDDDGMYDDRTNVDNFCDTHHLRVVLENRGYEHGVDLWHWYQPEASHSEAAWAERVNGEAVVGGTRIVDGGPVQIFSRL